MRAPVCRRLLARLAHGTACTRCLRAVVVLVARGAGAFQWRAQRQASERSTSKSRGCVLGQLANFTSKRNAELSLVRNAPYTRRGTPPPLEWKFAHDDDELIVRASLRRAKEPGARKPVPWETR